MKSDQASTLRRLVQTRAHVSRRFSPQTLRHSSNGGPRILSITSGKGGVGKTHIVVNLAYALRQLGARVLILDADLGLANVDVLLGLAPRFTLQHVLRGEKRLDEILLTGPQGMLILPASSGVQELTELSEAERTWLLAELQALTMDLDFLLVDTGAGISANVMFFNAAAQEIVVVVTPEPTSLTDAYALIKVLSGKYAERHFQVLMNAVATAAEARETFRRLGVVTERFLQISLEYLGFIPRDSAFVHAVRQQKAVLELYPHSAAARSLQSLARHMLARQHPATSQGTMQYFWQRFLSREAESPSASPPS